MWLWEEQGGLMGPFSFLLLVLLLLTRSPFNACLFTGSLYLLLRLFSFEPVPSRRAMQVLKPRDRVSAIAHRGGSHDAPENTLAAIRQAAKNGAAGVELDLEFTSDGIPVLMHDNTVDRTTDGTGRLCDLTFEQIRKLNPAANHRLRNDFPNEKIPTLREAVAECLNHNLTIFFDVKGHAYKATDALKKYIWSFLNYTIIVSSALSCQKLSIRDYLKKWSAKGIQVVAWTVNTFDEKSYYESHLGSSYITDSMLEDCTPQF